MKLSDHPLTQKVALYGKMILSVVAVGSLVFGSFHAYWYVKGLESAIHILQIRNAELVELAKRDDARQTNWLKLDEKYGDTIEGQQVQIMTLMVKLLEKVEDGERARMFMVDKISALDYKLGFHAGQHAQIDTMKGH